MNVPANRLEMCHLVTFIESQRQTIIHVDEPLEAILRIQQERMAHQFSEATRSELPATRSFWAHSPSFEDMAQVCCSDMEEG